MYKQISKDISWRCTNKCLNTFHGDVQQISKDISWICTNKSLKTFHGDVQTNVYIHFMEMYKQMSKDISWRYTKKCLKTFHGDVQTNDAKATTYYDLANGVEARSY